MVINKVTLVGLTVWVVVIAIITLVLSMFPAEAQTCHTVETARSLLTSVGEVFFWQGEVSEDRGFIQVWGKLDQSQWSIWHISGDVACLLSNGGGWEIPSMPPAEPQGVPG
jgi:hypothetical protein